MRAHEQVHLARGEGIQKRFSRASACCSARISVGVMSAPCTPFLAARRKASPATTVFPLPTSPWSRRAIARPEERSAAISRSARVFARSRRRARGALLARAEGVRPPPPARSPESALPPERAGVRLSRGSPRRVAVRGCPTPPGPGPAKSWAQCRRRGDTPRRFARSGADRPPRPSRRTPSPDSPDAARRAASRPAFRRARAPCPTAPSLRTRDNGCARPRGRLRYRRRRRHRGEEFPAASWRIGPRAGGREAWPLAPPRAWPPCRSAVDLHSEREGRAGSLRRFECPPARAAPPARVPGVESARADRGARAPPAAGRALPRKALLCRWVPKGEGHVTEPQDIPMVAAGTPVASGVSFTKVASLSVRGGPGTLIEQPVRQKRAAAILPDPGAPGCRGRGCAAAGGGRRPDPSRRGTARGQTARRDSSGRSRTTQRPAAARPSRSPCLEVRRMYPSVRAGSTNGRAGTCLLPYPPRTGSLRLRGSPRASPRARPGATGTRRRELLRRARLSQHRRGRSCEGREGPRAARTANRDPECRPPSRPQPSDRKTSQAPRGAPETRRAP